MASVISYPLSDNSDKSIVYTKPDYKSPKNPAEKQREVTYLEIWVLADFLEG